MKKLFFFSFIMAMFISISLKADNKIKQVEPNEIPSGAFILDIRTPMEYKALSLVRDHVYLEMSEVNPQGFANKYGVETQEIYILCNTGARAESMAKAFKKSGFHNVTVIKGGMQKAKSQLETTSGAVILTGTNVFVVNFVLIAVGFLLAVSISKVFFIIPAVVIADIVHGYFVGFSYLEPYYAYIPMP